MQTVHTRRIGSSAVVLHEGGAQNLAAGGDELELVAPVGGQQRRRRRRHQVDFLARPVGAAADAATPRELLWPGETVELPCLQLHITGMPS